MDQIEYHINSYVNTHKMNLPTEVQDLEIVLQPLWGTASYFTLTLVIIQNYEREIYN